MALTICNTNNKNKDAHRNNLWNSVFYKNLFTILFCNLKWISLDRPDICDKNNKD